ncbi:MAG: DsbA family protein [Nitrospirota bacterium]|nr:DsbA family protein [Nitrospirota bacterium]
MNRLAADYFTDPLCSWSWCNEPLYRRLVWTFGHGLIIHHRMGGLLAARNASFADAEFGLSGEDPGQYRLHQEEVCRDHRMPFDGSVWQRHPPLSSHPACIAVKAAGLQGLDDPYLRRVREAFFTGCRPVDRVKELVSLAAAVPGMDVERFAEEVDGPLAREHFADDLAATRQPLPGARDVKTEADGSRRYGFPTLIMMNDKGEVAAFDGDSTFDDYIKGIARLDPDLSAAAPPDPRAYLERFRCAATREVAMACGVDDRSAREELEALKSEGEVAIAPTGTDLPLWCYSRGALP